jgi:N utilization substance protein A
MISMSQPHSLLAIGRRGQNVRLASKLCGWDIAIMTHDELSEGIDKAVNWFSQIPDLAPELVETFIEEGFLSYDDLTFLEPAQLAELASINEEQAEDIIAFAEEAAERVEEEAKVQRAAEAEARAAAAAAGVEPPAPAAPRPATPTAATLFREDGERPPEEARPTMETLFGPDNATPTPEEPALSAAQVFGEAPPAPPAEDAEPAGEEGTTGGA